MFILHSLATCFVFLAMPAIAHTNELALDNTEIYTKSLGALTMLLVIAVLLQIRLQGVPLPGIGTVPTQAIQALPYLATVLLLAGFVGRAITPKAIGQPYVKER